jgi:hypothetical protein
MVGDRLVPATDTSLNDFNTESRITRAALTFNDQKNAVRGEQIGHTATNDPQLCPCKALARISAHLRSVQAKPDTPLYVYQYPDLLRKHVSPTNVNKNALRHSANDIQHLTGIDPSLLSARSLHPGGATALLCTGIDTDVIQLLGRWKSDAMLRYLRVAALTHTSNLSQQMLTAGTYTFAPTTYTASAHPVPVQAPAAFIQAITRENLYND